MKKLLLALTLGASLGAMAQPVATIQTNVGTIKVQLAQKEAPKSVANFIQYANSGYYNGTVFHRVIDGFMVQGGGFDAKMNQKTPNAPIINEAANGLKNQIGTLAMARTSEPNSATSQFFINVANNGFLDYKNSSAQGIGYAVFGKVISGMDVVNKIAKVPTGNQGMHENVPNKPIIIQKVSIQN